MQNDDVIGVTLALTLNTLERFLGSYYLHHWNH